MAYECSVVRPVSCAMFVRVLFCEIAEKMTVIHLLVVEEMDYYYSPMELNKNYSKYSPKFFLALILCLLVRLIPLRAPNIEPILATTMPLSKAYGVFFGFSFPVLSILLYDMITHTLGVQTLFTVFAYGVLGIWSSRYFKNKKGTSFDYVGFAVIGTIFFDAVTGLTVGPLFFHQTFLASLLGQIPFTALHLVGNVIFAYVLSPGIYNFLIKKKTKESAELISILNPKIT